MPTDYNENPPWPSGPVANEASPGLGSKSTLIEQQRRESGGLSDDPPDNPVRETEPFRVTNPGNAWHPGKV